jgi:tape measure domain-containing protein
MGSVSEGETAFQWVKDFAQETPLNIEQVTQSFIALKGSGLDPMDGTLKALTDSTAKYTGGTEKLENITRQLSQAWAKGRISAEDMKTTVENGLPAWVLLSKATGKTVGELRNMSEKSQLGRYHLRLLFEEMKNDAPNAAAGLMQTLNGQWDVAIANLQSFYDLIAQSGSLDFLTEKLTGLNAEIKTMAQDGRLKQYAQELSDKFIQMATSISGSIKTLFTDLEGFATSVKKTFASVQIPIKGFTIAIRGIIAIVAEFGSVASSVMSGVTSAFGLLPNAISNSHKEISKFLDSVKDEALSQMNADIVDLNASLDVFRKSTENGSKGISGFNDKVGEITKAVQPLGNALNATGAEALEMANNITLSGSKLLDLGIPVDRLKETIAVLINKLKEDPSPAVKQIVSNLNAQYKSLGDTAQANSEKVTKTLKDIEQEFRNTGGKSLSDLRENVENTLEVFNRFSEAKKPVSELRQAFLNQLAAQLELSKAQNDIVLPSQLALQASTLGLSDEFNKAQDEVTQYSNKLLGLSGIQERLREKQENLTRQRQTSASVTEKEAEALERLNQQNEAAASHAGANLAFQKLWNEARERSLQLYDLSALSVDNLREKTKQLGTELASAFRTQSWSNILKPINDLNNAAKQNELQAIAQEKAYRSLFSRLESGSVSVEQLQHLTDNAAYQFDKLSNTKLTALHAQINTAREATQSLSGELTNTITTLKNELDQLEGNQQAVLKRNFEADKAELQQKLDSAQKAQDRDAINSAQEALSIQRKIYDLRTAEITQESNVKNNVTTSETVNRTIKTIEEPLPNNTNISRNNPASTPVNNTVSTSLVNSIEKLIKTLSASTNNTNNTNNTSQPKQVNNAPTQTVRLEVILNGETYEADLQSGFEELFMRNLELQNSVQGN